MAPDTQNGRVTLAVLGAQMDALHEDVVDIKRQLDKLQCIEMRERVTRVEETSKRNAGIVGGIIACVVSGVLWLAQHLANHVFRGGG